MRETMADILFFKVYNKRYTAYDERMNIGVCIIVIIYLFTYL